jgi:hypothetical protein
VGEALAITLLGLPAVYVLAVAAPLIRAPQRWPSSGRWIVWGRLERHPRPNSSEIRFWAVVWAAIAVAWVAVITAVVFFAGD